MTQKEAVFNAIETVFDEDDIEFESGHTNVASILKLDKRARVVNLIIGGFVSKEIVLSEDTEGMLQDEEALKAYAISLVSYWLRKDSRLNGGVNCV